MGTFTSKAIIDQLIENNGHYPGDPQISKIVEYTDNWGNTAWGVVYPWEDQERYRESDYVHNPKTIWQREEVK